jgi:hypothetical protein
MALIVRRDIVNLIVSKLDEPYLFVTLTKGQEIDLDAILKRVGGDDDKLKGRLEQQIDKLKRSGGVVDSGNSTLSELRQAELEKGAQDSQPPGEEKAPPAPAPAPTPASTSKPSTGS